MTSQRDGAGVAVLEGQLYMVGGQGNGRFHSSVERYDPIQKKWTNVAAMSLPRAYLAAATSNGHLYAVGGFDSTSSAYDLVERYDPVKNEWITMASMTSKRYDFGLATVGNHLYAVGGHDNSSALSSAERYDPNTNKWTTIEPMKSSRRGLGLVSLNGQLYALGGSSGAVSSSFYLSSVERFDPLDNKWEIVAELNSRRVCIGAGVINNQLYVVGGYDGSYLTMVERYDVEKNTWQAIKSMLSKRRRMGVTVIGV